MAWRKPSEITQLVTSWPSQLVRSFKISTVPPFLKEGVLKLAKRSLAPVIPPPLPVVELVPAKELLMSVTAKKDMRPLDKRSIHLEAKVLTKTDKASAAMSFCIVDSGTVALSCVDLT